MKETSCMDITLECSIFRYSLYKSYVGSNSIPVEVLITAIGLPSKR